MLDEQQAATSVSFIIISVILSTIVVATMVGNLFVILAILFDKNLQTTANQLVLSLAVADLMVACLVMPLGAYNDIHNGWHLSKEVCEFWTSADVLCCTASILNLLAIAVDRYWAVTNVDYIYRRTRRRVNLMILCAWTVGAVVSLAPIFGWKDPDFAKRVVEEHKCMVSQDMSYQIFATISTFYAPLVLLLALYWRIFQVARKRIRRKPGQSVGASAKVSAEPIVCLSGAPIGCTALQMPSEPKSRSTGRLTCNNGPDSLMTNCSIQAVGRKHTNNEHSSIRVTSAAAKVAFGPEPGSTGSGAQSNYNIRGPTRPGAAEQGKPGGDRDGSITAAASAAVYETQTTPAAELDSKEMALSSNSEHPVRSAEAPDSQQPDGMLKVCTVGEADEERPAARGETHDTERRRAANVDLTASGSGAGKSQTNSSVCGCRILERQNKKEGMLSLPCHCHCSSDDKNNGPEQPGLATGEDWNSARLDEQHQQQPSRQRRKEGWRKNKVSPIEELCPSPGPSQMGPSPIHEERQDPPAFFAAAASDSISSRQNHCREKVNDGQEEHVDEWERRPQGLGAGTQAFGSLSPRGRNRVSRRAVSGSSCISDSRQSSRLFDAGSIGRQTASLLLSSWPSGVKMDEGDPAMAKRQHLSYCCLSSERRSSETDNAAGHRREHQKGSGEKEMSQRAGCDGSTCRRLSLSPSLREPHDEGRLAASASPPLAAAFSDRQINHEPAAPSYKQNESAYLVDDDNTEPKSFGAEEAAAVAGGNFEACLKSSKIQRSATVPEPTAVATEVAAVLVVAAAANGLNNKLDKRNQEAGVAWSCMEPCRGCTPAGPMGASGRVGAGSGQPYLVRPAPGDQPSGALDINQLTATPHLALTRSQQVGDDDDGDDLSTTSAQKLAGGGNQAGPNARTYSPDDSSCTSGSSSSSSSGNGTDRANHDLECSLSASSSLLACIHRADQRGRQDDVDGDEFRSDEDESSSLSSSFPPHPRDLFADVGDPQCSSTSLLPAQGAGRGGGGGGDTTAKSHKRLLTSGRINNLIRELAASSTKSVTAAADVDDKEYERKSETSVLHDSGAGLCRPTSVGHNLSTKSLPQTTSTAASAPTTGIRAPAGPMPMASKVRGKLERRDPIEVHPLKWPAVEVSELLPRPIQRQGRSSLQIRRRFRAMGQLVSFVQTSHNLSGSPSPPSSSASSSRSATADNLLATATATAAAAASASELELAVGAPQEKPRMLAHPGDLSEMTVRKWAAVPSGQVDVLDQRQPLVTIVSGNMIDRNKALCRQQPDASEAANMGRGKPLTSSVAANSAPPSSSLQFQLDSGGNNHHHHHHHHHHLRQKQTSRLASSSTGGRSRSANMDIKREKKAAKTLAIITGVFVCCWLPFFLNAIIMPVCGPACTPSDLVLSILLWLGYLNSLLNPMIYTIFSPDFRRAFRRLLCWPQLISFGCCNCAQMVVSTTNPAGKLAGSW